MAAGACFRRQESMESLSSDLFPPLGSTNTIQHVRLRSFIISPYNPIYRWWENIMGLLVLYWAWASPFELAFLQTPFWPLVVTDCIFDALFTIDIVLTFFVAFVDKNTQSLVDDRSRIAKRYIFPWLVMDVASALPIQGLSYMNIFLGTHIGSSLPFKIFNTIRLWRLRRLGSLFSRVEKNTRVSYWWIRWLKILSVGLLIVHCAGCIYYWIATLYPEEEDNTWIGSVLPHFREIQPPWLCYIYSIYWSITTLSTVGYGDLHAHNCAEMIFETIYMILNVSFIAYLIGNVTNLVVHSRSRTRKFRDSAHAISCFAKRNGMPPQLEDKMQQHLRLKLKTERLQLQEHSVAADLPNTIRCSIAQILFIPTLQKTYLFHGVSYPFLRQLVSEMKAEYFPPGEDIIIENQTATEFYIVVSGAVESVTCKDGAREQNGEGIAKSGDVIGEVEVICERAQAFTFRTLRLSQLLRVDRNMFIKVLQANGVDGQIVINNLLNKNSKNQVDGAGEMEAEIFQIVMEGPRDLCSSARTAVSRGKNNNVLLEHLRMGMRMSNFPTSVNEIENETDGACHQAIRELRLSKWHDRFTVPGSHINSCVRVSIHRYCRQDEEKEAQMGFLIVLPTSLDDLLRIASQKLKMDAMVILTEDLAVVDDIKSLRDNDKLYILDEPSFSKIH